MDVWQVVLSAASTAITAAVGYVWTRIATHESRIVKLETMVDGELHHIREDLAELKADVKFLRDRQS